MKPTDTSYPQYYHRVVDCQWACPAHTNVPEYIRLIAQGKYSESYLLNRESNVFPGILGRTCDRPCEPACRRTRIDGKPVAICRLKRVASDNKGDISAFLPTAPAQKNGKRIGLIGCGPASLTVANDLMPLGCECVIFERHAETGGLMRAPSGISTAPAGPPCTKRSLETRMTAFSMGSLPSPTITRAPSNAVTGGGIGLVGGAAGEENRAERDEPARERASTGGRDGRMHAILADRVLALGRGHARPEPPGEQGSSGLVRFPGTAERQSHEEVPSVLHRPDLRYARPAPS